MLNSNNAPRLSIVIPVFNAGRFLPRCLSSVLGQQLTDFELICVNDGSTDESLSVLEECAATDSRVTVLSQSNSGQSIARNRGIDAARGEYVGFCDADDTVDVDFFAKLLASATASGADIAMAGTKFNNTRCATQPAGVYESLAEKIALLPNGAVWDKIYRRDMLARSNVRFPAGVVWEDNEFLIRAVSAAGKLVVIDDTFYNYVDNPDSTSREHSGEKELRRSMDAIHVSQHMLAFAQANGFGDDALLELHRFIARTLPWWEMFNNPRMSARIGKLEEVTETRDQLCRLFGRFPLFTIENRRGWSTWRLFGSIRLFTFEDTRK